MYKLLPFAFEVRNICVISLDSEKNPNIRMTIVECNMFKAMVWPVFVNV